MPSNPFKNKYVYLALTAFVVPIFFYLFHFYLFHRKTVSPDPIVIDRTQWKENNLILVSVVYDHRAIPLYATGLPKKGNSNLEQ